MNQYNDQNGLDRVAYSTIIRFTEHHNDIICRQPRKHRKSGKTDPESVWAKARLAQFLQIKEQLEQGEASEPQDHPRYPPIKLDAIVFWDEHHEQVVLGHTSQIETRIRKDEDGFLATEEEGGQLPERHEIVDAKFPGNVGGCFGVAMRKNSETQQNEGIKCCPFGYMGRTVVGVKRFSEELKAEAARVISLHGQWENKGGYFGRYGEVQGKIELKKKVDRIYCCITDIMDHVIAESNKVYAATVHADTYLIFHDALTQWWERDAQDYLESKGFKSRQVRNLNDENSHTRYHEKLCGDSPEMCRGCDSHGFAHLRESIALHTSLSSLYDIDDPRRFSTGTPAQLWTTMTRCWEVAPTSADIITDITSFPHVINVLIENKGCVVPVRIL